jgi:hypothetical protein
LPQKEERLYTGLKAKAGIVSGGNIRQLQSGDEGARREGTADKRRYGWEASVTAGKEIEDDTAEICKVGHVHIKANESGKFVVWVGGERLKRREPGAGESG